MSVHDAVERFIATLPSRIPGIDARLARPGEAHPDLCDFMDGVAIHPYTFLQQPEPELSLDFGVYRYPDSKTFFRQWRKIVSPAVSFRWKTPWPEVCIKITICCCVTA